MEALRLILVVLHEEIESMLNKLYALVFVGSLVSLCAATTVTDIQGPAFQSPLVGKTVNVTALVTAKVMSSK